MKMTELAKSFESLKLKNVKTFIASGNVIFESSEKQTSITKKIETELSKLRGYKVDVMLRTSPEVQSIVKNKMTDSATVKNYVVFLSDELKSEGKKWLLSLNDPLNVVKLKNREICVVHRAIIGKPLFPSNFEKKMGIRATIRSYSMLKRLSQTL